MLPDYVTVTNPIPTVKRWDISLPPACSRCVFWQVDDDGEAGECTSPLFRGAVWSMWDKLSPLETAHDFSCMYFEMGK